LQTCYELHTVGPCAVNETYIYSRPMNHPYCVPALCDRSDMALTDDGNCHFLNTRGPCGADSVLRVDKRTNEPACHPSDASRVRRKEGRKKGGLQANVSRQCIVYMMRP
jgi:hypothetical protein